MIGVLDSGVGGLSVLREIHRLLPQNSTLYFADQAHAPYGPRPHDEIHQYVSRAVRDLLDNGATVIVLACHAASAASLHTLREDYPQVPFIGIEPAVKPAVAHSQQRVIGVLTTQATADGRLYQRVLARFAAGVTVITQIAPELVLAVEQGGGEVSHLLEHYLLPLVTAGADEIVLACTHFPFLHAEIRAIVGDDVAIVDPGPAVARQVARVIPASGSADSPVHRYVTSGDPARMQVVAQMLLGYPVIVYAC